jgi:hypothetical protein
MCFYAISIFSGCGHVVRSSTPVLGGPPCPHRNQQMRTAQTPRTPSLISSSSGQPTPRTTISSLDSLTLDKLNLTGTYLENNDCDEVLSHPMYIHRLEKRCDDCEEAVTRRLEQLEIAVIAEVQETMAERARRSRRHKTMFQGKRPRQLELVKRQEPVQQPTPAQARSPGSPTSIRDTASALRGFWNSPLQSLRSPSSPGLVPLPSSPTQISASASSSPLSKEVKPPDGLKSSQEEQSPITIYEGPS